MTTTLFRNGTVRTLADGAPVAEWLLVDGELVAGFGPSSDAPAADRVVDLEGGTLVPAFCDAHVHLAATGLHAAGLDLRGERSARRIVAALAERSRAPGGVLFGGSLEERLEGGLSRRELDAAVGDRQVLLARTDTHSALVSSALLRELDLDAVEGIDRDEHGAPTGYLRERAAGEAWRWFEAHLPFDELAAALRSAVRLAYGKGVAAVHEMYVVEWRGWRSLDALAEVAGSVALEVTPYVATTDVAGVRARGYDRIGGDLFLDGTFGSHSAWLTEPYDPPAVPLHGIPYRSDDELVDFLARAHDAGMQTGVHAIGDAAIEQALRCWEKVAESRGLGSVRSLSHRIEHFEYAHDEQIARAARLGLGISVQPAFDRFWGGPEGMYAARMGWARAAVMNRFRTMAEAGLVVGAGSDSPVTPLDPFLQMAALRSHHRADQRLDAVAALRAHTLGAHALAGREGSRGTLEAGKRASVAWLDRDPVDAEPDAVAGIDVLGTWIGGARVWPMGDAESD